MKDPYNLQRFVDAQDPVYARVSSELLQGRKSTHWMWFIFPQIQGLGSSETAQYFAISSLEEARAYLEHPVLGPRLSECTQLVCHTSGKTARQIFGFPDDMKLRSSMTLFAHAGRGPGIFGEALQKFFAGEEDPLTLERIRG